MALVCRSRVSSDLRSNGAGGGGAATGAGVGFGTTFAGAAATGGAVTTRGGLGAGTGATGGAAGAATRAAGRGAGEVGAATTAGAVPGAGVARRLGYHGRRGSRRDRRLRLGVPRCGTARCHDAGKRQHHASRPPQRRKSAHGYSGTANGIVPTLSQLHDHVLHVARADHLDIVGHFSLAGGSSGNWLPSGAGFTREAFDTTWEAIAGALARGGRSRRG